MLFTLHNSTGAAARYRGADLFAPEVPEAPVVVIDAPNARAALRAFTTEAWQSGGFAEARRAATCWKVRAVQISRAEPHPREVRRAADAARRKGTPGWVLAETLALGGDVNDDIDIPF